MQQFSVPPKTRGMKKLEARLGIDVPERLRLRYVDEGRNQDDIATELGIDVSTVSKWMTRLGIETRIFASDKAP